MGKRWVPPQTNDRHHRLCDCRWCNEDRPETPEQRRRAEAKRNGLA